jgi:uncharacterized protein
MRRADREIADPAAVEALLREGDVLCLATHDAEGPYVVPLDYAYRDGVVWIHCAPDGRKLDAVAADPRVSFSVVARHELVTEGKPCEWTSRFTSVIGFGHARVVTEGDELHAGVAALVERHGGDPGLLPAEPDGVAVIRIDVDRLTGKASGG